MVATNILISIIGTVIFGVLFMRHLSLYRAEKFDLMSPPWVFGVGFFAYHIITNWYYSINIRALGEWANLPLLWLSVLVAYLVVVGISVVAKKSPRASVLRLALPNAMPTPVYILFAVYCFGLVFVNFLFFRGAENYLYRSTSEMLFNAAAQILHCFPLVTALYIQGFKSLPFRKLILVIVLILSLFILFVFEGSERRTFVRVILFAALGWNYFIEKIKFWQILLLIVAIVPTLYLLRIEQTARNYYDRSLTELTVEDFADIQDKLESDGGKVQAQIKSLDVFIGTENLDSILRHFTVHQMDWGASYWKLFVTFVPRSIFPNKPVEPTARVRYEIPTPSVAAHQTITFIGEAYWNFGWAGIVIVPFAIGWFTRRFYEWGSGQLGYWQPSLFYCLLVPFLLEHFRGGFHTINLIFLITLAQVLFFMKLSSLKMFRGRRM